MKKTYLALVTATLVLSLGVCSAYGGKPVDNDGDGVKSNLDCNDNNADVYPGAPELCDGIDNQCPGDAGYGVVDEGCGACTPTGTPETVCNGIDDDCDDLIDEDYASTSTNCGLGVCASSGQTTCVDGVEGDTCTPGLPTETPEQTCTDTLDNDCDGAADGADSDCVPGGGPHSSLTYADYPTACLGCHDGGAGGVQYDQMWNSTHYQWLGEAVDMTNQQGTQQGKLTNAVNSYCINILGDWPVCGSCHVGRGMKPGTTDTKANIDCLMCHSVEYADVRTRLPDGTMGVAAPTDSMVQNISKPTRLNCLKCHAKAGGGDAVKRGDLSLATITNADANFDVHMNSASSDLTCQSCHVFDEHKVIGKGSDLRPTDDVVRGSEVTCVTCHVGMDSGTGHADAGANRTDADRHINHVACQACHVETYAKVATEVQRDWRMHHGETGPTVADGVSGPGHPHTVKAADLAPEYMFWDRTSDNYLQGDAAIADTTKSGTYDGHSLVSDVVYSETYPTSRPNGDINNGKLYAFKYKTALQPMVTADNTLIALNTFTYIKGSGDVQQAIEEGLVAQGYPANEPHEWVATDTYQMLNHGIDPAVNVTCEKCHGSDNLDPTTDSKLDVLGYKLKDDSSLICAQCHRDKTRNMKNQAGMHTHLNKGSGIDCLFCHTFTRAAEKGLCSPCDPACVSEFVDNNPYDHSADCTP